MICTIVTCEKCGAALKWGGSFRKSTLTALLRKEGWSVGKPKGENKYTLDTLCPNCRRVKKAVAK